MHKKIAVFTDGSSRGNPGPGGWGAVIASTNNVYELSGRADKTTNNRMELTACAEVLKFLKTNNQQSESIAVNTDSQYLINGFEKWLYGWQKNNWQTSKKEPVLNQDLWQELAGLKPLFPNLALRHVRGHVGIPGNERADFLATEAADNKKLKLYRGVRANYPIDLVVPEIKSLKPTKSRGRAYCYLSYVEGQLIIHDSWADCKKRVSGKPGAKFRRANSAAERDEIIETWQAS